MAAAEDTKAKTVFVACKLPSGLIAEIRLNDGAKRRVTFNGSAPARRLERADDNGRIVGLDPNMAPNVQAGFGLTEVPADFWEVWIKQNRQYEPVRRGLIFASAERASASAQAQEQQELLSGLEPLDPSKPSKDITPLERGE